MKSLFFFSLLAIHFNLTANVKLPALISDNMVLQQQSTVIIWGWADENEKVTVSASWGMTKLEVTTNKVGEWKLKMNTPSAGGPYNIVIRGKNKIEIKNMMIGEVWLCSGQSNMEFPIGNKGRWKTGVLNYEKEISKANYPNIRMFTVKHKVAQEPLKDVNGQWDVCSPEKVGDFSAVGYYFARELAVETGYSIGLINSSWGGTPAESWVRRSVLENSIELESILRDYKKNLELYKQSKTIYGKDNATLRTVPDTTKKMVLDSSMKSVISTDPSQNPKSATKLFNGMIAPLIQYSLKGIIWYQGESNDSRPYQYSKLFPALIKSWRKEWKDKLPFYFVQIAPHFQKHPELRDVQLRTFKSVPKTGIVIITDASDSLDIHPRNKEIPGKRLALWALAKDYGKNNITYSGPIYRSMKVVGDKVWLEFDYAYGLHTKGKLLNEFTIAGEDRKFLPATAGIRGDNILISNAFINKPVAVRFAWKNFSRPNLYNDADLPASPFRTDDWVAETPNSTR